MTLDATPADNDATLAEFDPVLCTLLACARTRMTPGGAASLSSVSLAPPEATRLLDLAMHHGLVPLLHRHLPGTALPAPERQRLQSHARESAMLNLALYAELNRILDHLHAAGIPAVPYKGPALAMSYYGNATLREFRDLDLLVRRDDVPRIKKVLIQQGYAPEYPLTEAAERIHIREATDYAFARDRGRSVVEIHWRLMPRYLTPPMETSFWTRLVPSALGQRIVRSIGPEDLLIYLCAHGTKHAWERLTWVVDIAEIIHARPEIDWGRMLALARELRSACALRLGLRLAADYLDAPLPEALATALRADRRLSHLARRSVEGWSRALPPKSRHVAAFHLASRDRWQERIRYVLLRALNLNAHDWRFVALPPGLIGLYYPLRLVRLAGEAVTRLIPGR